MPSSVLTSVRGFAKISVFLAGPMRVTPIATIITSEEEYDRIVAIVDRLEVRRDPSVEEERLLELLSTLVEVYENEHCPIPDAPPHVMIQQFMLDRGLRQADLVRAALEGLDDQRGGCGRRAKHALIQH